MKESVYPAGFSALLPGGGADRVGGEEVRMEI